MANYKCNLPYSVPVPQNKWVLFSPHAKKSGPLKRILGFLRERRRETGKVKERTTFRRTDVPANHPHRHHAQRPKVSSAQTQFTNTVYMGNYKYERPYSLPVQRNKGELRLPRAKKSRPLRRILGFFYGRRRGGRRTESAKDRPTCQLARTSRFPPPSTPKSRVRPNAFRDPHTSKGPRARRTNSAKDFTAPQTAQTIRASGPPAPKSWVLSIPFCDSHAE